MAVYGWIYANAKIRGDGGDYLVRRCDSGLEGYKDMLTSLSRGMLSTTKRYGQAEGQECWLFGFLDKGRRCPIVAVAGEQERLLGMSLAGGGFRRQYCVLGWAFEGESIRICKRDDRIFEPLKEMMREIQRTGKSTASGEGKWKASDSAVFDRAESAEEDSAGQKGGIRDDCFGIPADFPHMACNIIKSGSGDDILWEKSLCVKPPRPIMTGCLGVEEAKRMLDYFPDGLATVAGDIEPQYYSGRKEQKRNRTGTKDGRGRVCVGPDGVVIMTEGWHGEDGSRISKFSCGRGAGNGQDKPGGSHNAEYGGRAAGGGETAGKQMPGNRNPAEEKENVKAGKGISRKEEKRQLLAKEREEAERKKIIECAKRCREALDKKSVEDILDAVGRMGLKDGFSQQMRFFGCMYLWRSIYLGRNAGKSRKEISYFLEAWKKEVKNKNGAFQANKIMADEVMKLMGRGR